MTSSMSSLVSLVVALLVVASSSSLSCLAYQCGDHGGGASCADGLCCSRWGWCGTGDDYCAPENCQSQCPIPSPPPPVYDITDTVDTAMYYKMFPNMRCSRIGYFEYSNFVTAARSFPGFGTTGNNVTRKREVAAFLAQTGFETALVWISGGDISEHGYCLDARDSHRTYCTRDPQWLHCPRRYYPRGPIMLKYDVIYEQAGEALGLDLINDPDLLVWDPILGFKSAIWFWMTELSAKPSCHDVMIGNWKPSVADLRAGRLPGYGLTTNIITTLFNSTEFECGKLYNQRVQDRITFYERACRILGVDPGINLDCFLQEPFKVIRPTLLNTE